MPEKRERKHFIVKHDLDSLTVLPQFVWRTGVGPRHAPGRFPQIKRGDRWVAFAYTTSDGRDKPLSLITGFFECAKEARWRHIPPQALSISGGETHAWVIEGRRCGRQPGEHVGVKPLDDILGRHTFHGQGITPITPDDFQKLRAYAFAHQLRRDDIPLLGREPTTEQEVLALVAAARSKLGIEKILKVQKAFPDLLVKLEGTDNPVYLELELCSRGFFGHGHEDGVRHRCYAKDGIPVGVLCWLDDEKSRELRRCVHRIFELRSLLLSRRKIRWQTGRSH